jgi:hypothetical protein
MPREIRNGIRFEIQGANDVRGLAFGHENNDCTVRAIKHLTGVPYSDSHALCKRLGRRDKRGLNTVQLQGLTALPHAYGYKVTRVILPAMLESTLGRAMLSLHKGRYLIIKTGHAIACIDGVLYDSGASGPGSRVLMVFKFTPSSQWESENAKAGTSL